MTLSEYDFTEHFFKTFFLNTAGKIIDNRGAY
mgnify:CR=1 FL=1|jgi:hypothetical protein